MLRKHKEQAKKKSWENGRKQRKDCMSTVYPSIYLTISVSIPVSTYVCICICLQKEKYIWAGKANGANSPKLCGDSLAAKRLKSKPNSFERKNIERKLLGPGGVLCLCPGCTGYSFRYLRGALVRYLRGDFGDSLGIVWKQFWGSLGIVRDGLG